MLAFPKESKWTLICQNQNKAALGTQKDLTPEAYVKMLKSNPTYKEIGALRVSLHTLYSSRGGWYVVKPVGVVVMYTTITRGVKGV